MAIDDDDDDDDDVDQIKRAKTKCKYLLSCGAILFS